MSSVKDLKKPDMNDFERHRKLVVDLLSSADNGDLEMMRSTVEVIKTSTGAASTREVLTEFKDGNKRVAMHFAAAKGRRKMMDYLLDQAPVLLNVQDEEGSTPLFLASRANEFSSVRVLLERGALATVTQKNGTSALHEAAGNGSVRTIKLLLEHGAALDAVSTHGTPLHFAVNEDRVQSLEELLLRGANVNLTNAKGVTPLLLSVMLNKPALVHKLLASHADVKLTLPGGITALHIAAEAGFIECVKELLGQRELEARVLANAKFEGGATPLQLAAGKGHREIVELLRPLTTGFQADDVDVDALMLEEQKKMESYLAEATKRATADTKDSSSSALDDAAKQALLAGVIPDEEVVAPTSGPVSEETQARATALKDQGNREYLAKQYASAIALYTEAITLTPADGVLYSNRCAAHLGAGDAKTALNDIRVAKKLKPEWAKAHFREGQCLEALTLFEDAAVAMWAAIQLEPKNRALEKRFQECVARGRESHKKKTEVTGSA